MKLLPIIVGVVLLLQAAWCLVVGSGRNWTFQTSGYFADWYPKYGRTLKMLGTWGVAIGAIFLVAGIFEYLR